MAARARLEIVRFDPVLWGARFCWAAIVGVVASLIVVNAPSDVLATWREYQVRNAVPAIVSFTPTWTFASWLVRVRYLIVILYAAVALLIAWRKWRDWFALLVSSTLLLLAWALVLRGDQTTWVYPRTLIRLFPALPLLVGQLPFLGLIALFFLFPDGRFVFRWHKWLALWAGLLSFLFFLGDSFHDEASSSHHLNWSGPSPWVVWMGTLFISLFVALAGQVYRYRRLATRAQRQQMKWVVLGFASILAIPLLSWPLEDHAGPWGSLASIGLELAIVPLLPLTIGFSMFRYRLWDVDLIINRTLVYGGLTLLILALYALGVGAASRLLPASEGTLAPFLALLIVVSAIAPARGQLQRRADRWLPIQPGSTLAAAAIDAAKVEPAPGLRVARAGWLLLFVFLLWQVIFPLADIGELLQATRSEWIVQTSLRALPAGAASVFIRYLLVLRLGALAVYWITALVVFRQRGDESMALLVAYLLLLLPLGFALGGDELWLEQLAVPVFGLLILLTFIFPDGRFIPRSGRWRASLLVAALTVSLASYLLIGLVRPQYQPGERAYGSFILTLTIMMAAGVASQVYRYQRVATTVQRRQTKWVVFGLGLNLVWLFWSVLWLAGVLTGFGLSEAVVALTTMHLIIATWAALPVTLGISILRYHLWDIDLILNRALVFGGLTVTISLLYGLLVGALSFLAQAGGDVLLSVAATGLIAILFQPLRQRLQQGVNRLMYGERDDPVTVLSRLGEQMESVSVPGATLPALVQTVASALKLPYVAVELLGPDGVPLIAASSGQAPTSSEIAAGHRFPLIHQNEVIGALVVSQRAPGESFGREEERLLRNVARQAGTAVYASQVTEQLQRSRERLVTAREEERRRLRRDLHDGLGPRLATLSLKVDAARNYLARDRQASEKLLLELKQELQETIGEIRQIAHNLRPPALDQLGLVSALREYAGQMSGNGLRVAVEAPEPLPPLPAAVEVAAYRIAQEALANVIRHAGASRCHITLSLDGGLWLVVRDNGRGLPAAPGLGVGLASMRERAAELGGSLALASVPGGGAELRAFLPFTVAG
jgi:signal transduction histidine kinase